MKGQIISGEFNKIIAREKANAHMQLGEILVCEHDTKKSFLQVYDLMYASQISQANLELISGMKLEEETEFEMMDKNVRTYRLALLKHLLTIEDNTAYSAKTLPPFFSYVREVTKEDLSFLSKPESALSFGMLRSGSSVLSLPIHLDGKKILSEHILLSATTGRGKSNLISCLLWDMMNKDFCASLVLDPHDEYYGRTTKGLKDHETKPLYYTPYNPPPGAYTLKVNLNSIKPQHFSGAVNWSDAQREALYAYYRKYGTNWISAIVLDKPIENFFVETIQVIKRRILSVLDLEIHNNQITSKSIFDVVSGVSTIHDICKSLEDSKTVIIDTSSFSGSTEVLISSIITTEVFSRYKYYKTQGLLDKKPVISIVLEEAPRVLGKHILDTSANIFQTIAREGRKFKVGLIAITQLPSLIPRQILANMNTKIIMGVEMAPERQALIDSASQDLSQDDRTIASLDKGEAIVSSNFTQFAMPIKIPLFSTKLTTTFKKQFSGIDTNGTS